jgi:hypothetical protein
MPEFDPAETAAILEVYDHYEDPRSRDYSAVGLPLILLAFGIHGLVNGVLGHIKGHFSPAVMTVVMSAEGALVVTGFLCLLFGGAFSARAPREAVERAIALLETWDEADQSGMVRREAAIALLRGARYSAGPWSRATVDPAELRQRLGRSYDYVLHVERILRLHRQIAPVLTPIPAGSASMKR